MVYFWRCSALQRSPVLLELSYILLTSVLICPALCRLSYDVRRRDAYIKSLTDENDEGESHIRIEAPAGSEFTSIRVKENTQEEVAIFQTKDFESTDVYHAFIVLHGKNRNGDDYWQMLNDTIQSARDSNVTGAARPSIVIAPQFFSTVYNSGQYAPHELAWGDVNAWQAAETATHPNGTQITSTDALDAIIRHLSDTTSFPSMTNLTILGHGGGGQLIQRYAAIAADSAPHIHIRYVHGDASSCAYFTPDRPTDAGESFASTRSCTDYNSWRYGFDHFPGVYGISLSPQEYFRRYIRRDVISIVGYDDTTSQGDETCMAKLQGGDLRRDRNLVWYRYVHSLARTNESLRGFPGEFDRLPDWSSISRNRVSLRLTVIEDAAHDAEELFRTRAGRSTLFGDFHVEPGWRP